MPTCTESARGEAMNQVCGIINTYCPDDGVAANIEVLRPQVAYLIVVDNGSPTGLPSLREACSRFGCILLENEENRGITVGLARGIRYAQTLPVDFVVLFDQDSTADPQMVTAMLESYSASSTTKKVGIVSPTHTHKTTGKRMHCMLDGDGGPLTVILSGSMVPMHVFRECGTYEESMIMDRFDEDFSLRVRHYGYTIILSAAILWVVLGSPQPFRFLGKTVFYSSNYSPARHYYMCRNRIVVIRRYWRDQPVWCLRSMSGFCKETFAMLVAERGRYEKMKCIVHGIWDGFIGRMGLQVSLS
jgi:rhamnosyltransferase